MGWNLRYAAHLGYMSPDKPLFLDSVGSLDAVAHVEFAAELGFAGIQYAHALTRPEDERAAVAAAVKKHGMEVSGILYTPFADFFEPLWTTTTKEARDDLKTRLSHAFEVAKPLNCRCVIVVTGAEPDRPIEVQRRAYFENLSWAAELAENQDMFLGIEAITAKRRPGLLLHYIGDANDMVAAVGRPGVRLLFDTAHAQSMEGDIIRKMEECWDGIGLIQIANHPDRAEPARGELNILNILRAVKRRGYDGLVELEHNWAVPGREAEQSGIAELRRIDALLGEAG